jgi:DNA polymerase-1
MSEVKLRLNIRAPNDDSSERVKKAVERKKSSNETVEEAFERIWTSSKWNEKEARLYKVAKEACESGTIGRLSDGKLTKKEIMAMGTKMENKQEEEARRYRIENTLRDKPSNYHIITDGSSLSAMIERLREEVRLQQDDEWFSKVFRLFNETHMRGKLLERGIEIPLVKSLTVWDTETSGLDKMIDLSGGYSFWLPLLDEGYYVAYGHLGGEEQCTRSKALGVVKKFLELADHIKSFHNAEYDLNIFRNDGLRPAGVRYDSQDAQYILNEHEPSSGLKPLFTKYKSLIGGDALKMDDYTFEDLFSKQSPMPHSPEVVGIYAIKDVHKGWLLTKWQINKLIETDELARAYFEIRQYLPEVNVEITRTGFEIDLDELKRLGEDYSKQLEQAKRELIEAYKIDENFLYAMSLKLKGDKIREWCVKQEARIKKQAKMLADCETELAKSNPTTKKYSQLQERINRYKSTTLAEPIPQNAPDYITEFNLSSNDHLAYLIYDYLGTKDITKKVVKDKSRERAVSKDVLERYFNEEESLKPLAKVSLFEKLLGTYIEKIPLALDVDGRLHTELNTVSTGRYSSKGYTGKSNDLFKESITDDNFLTQMRRLVDAKEKSVSKGTNVQNIPSRNEEGLKVRKTFVPRKGYTFIGSDLSSIEPRIQAHRMSTEFGDDSFAEMYRKGLDPYVEFASLVFRTSTEKCTESYYKSVKGTPEAVPPYRKIMKQLFLAIGYGQAFDMFYKGIQMYGINEEDARIGYDKFNEILPGFKQMVEETFAHLRKYGWVQTLWGQKRRFPGYVEKYKRLCTLMKKAGIDGKNDPELAKKSYKLRSQKERNEFWDLIRFTGGCERSAFNHTIQGSGANVLQMCMIRSYYECTIARGWEFNLTLHDEQKHSIETDKLDMDAVNLYDDIMTNTVQLVLPLACDTVIEPRWMEEYSPREWDFENNKPKGE